MTEPLTCETCKNWFRMPRNPDALDQPRGHCRALPPQVIPLYTASQQMTNLGATLLMQPVFDARNVSAAYPALPPDFPACRQHMRRETWEAEAEEFL
jgi:hypothetical protein